MISQTARTSSGARITTVSSMTTSSSTYAYLHDGPSLHPHAIVDLTYLCLVDVVLFPGERLSFEQYFDPSVRHAIVEQNISYFGLVLGQVHPEVGYVPAQVGTVWTLTFGADRRLECHARQRFRFCQPPSTVTWNTHSLHVAKVEICPELDDLGHKLPRDFSRNCGFWSSWEIARFHGPTVMTRLIGHYRDVLHQWGYAEEREKQGDEPRAFSYWLARTAPLSNVQRQSMLALDLPVLRLQRMLSVLAAENQMMLYCIACNDKNKRTTAITHAQSIFQVTPGQSGNYVNPSGFFHQALTVSHVQEMNIELEDEEPTMEDSWFEGYAWTIVYCHVCKTHLGWQFDRVSDSSVEGEGEERKDQFFGLRRAALLSNARE